MTPSNVPTMSGTGVSSRIRARAEMYGLKFAASGFSGLYPTMSGNSLGGFLRSICAIRICRSPEQWPNVLRASGRPSPPHSRNPPIKQERYDCESDAANNSAREFESRADQCQRRVLAGEDDDCRNHHADNALADNQAGREQHAELLGGLRIGTAVCALLKEPPSNRADDNHQRALRRQINPEAHCQGWNAHVFCRARKDLVQENDADADQPADSNQAPIDVGCNHALRQGRNETGLRRRQRMWTKFSSGRADESIGMIHQVEYRWNDERARDDAEDQRHLLPPGRRMNQLASLKVLQIVVGNRSNVENDRCGKQRECHEGFACFRPDIRLHPDHQQQRCANDNQNANPRQRTVRRTDQSRHITTDRGNEETHQYDADHAADDEGGQMSAKTTGRSEIAEQPPDRQHTNQGEKTNNANRNIALGYW